MKTDAVILLLMGVAIFVFLAMTGTLTSGYHLTDDHEILRIADELRSESMVSAAVRWITRDLAMRFRPVFYVHRIMEAKVWGPHLIRWSVWTAILAFATFAFFYLGMRKLDFSVIESLLFVGLALVGPQAGVWWRLGVAETIGIFFLGAAFYFMISNEKHHVFYTALFCLSLIFSSWSKESFAVAAPAFVVFKVWYDKDNLHLSTKAALLKNMLLAVPLALVLAGLLYVVFVTGTNQLGYAGVDRDVFSIVIGSLKIIKNSLGRYFVMAAVALFFIFYAYRDKTALTSRLAKLIRPAIFTALVVLPNLVLYAKSGMFRRYLLPSTIGMAFFCISLLRIVHRYQDRRLFKFLIILLVPVFWGTVGDMLDHARSFAAEGRKTERMLSTVVQNSDEKTNILFVGNPFRDYERSFSLDFYLSWANDARLYVCPLNDVYDDDLKKRLSGKWHAKFQGRKFQDIEGGADMIIFFHKNLTGAFFKDSRLDPSGYRNLLSDDDEYVVYKTKTNGEQTAFP